MSRSITIQLVESPRGHALQAWTFENRDEVKIGRSLDNDIVIPHPCVSRSHASLIFEGGAWKVSSISDQGIYLAGIRSLVEWLRENDSFRLGPSGPYLRCVSMLDGKAGDDFTHFGPVPKDCVKLTLDEERLVREVSAITDDEYFRKIQHSVAKLRGR